MLEDRITRTKALLAKRDEIDAELAQLLGVEPRKPRGRPRKEDEKEKEQPHGATPVT